MIKIVLTILVINHMLIFSTMVRQSQEIEQLTNSTWTDDLQPRPKHTELTEDGVLCGYWEVPHQYTDRKVIKLCKDG